jgi:hypothetical protein
LEEPLRSSGSARPGFHLGRRRGALPFRALLPRGMPRFRRTARKGVVSCYEGTPALRDVSRWIWLRKREGRPSQDIPPRASIGSLEVQIVTPERNFTNLPRRVRWTPVEENGFTYCVLNEKVSGQILVYWS